MVKYTIEKGIPMDNDIRGPKPGCDYPFMDMKIGDSFLVVDITAKQLKRVHNEIQRMRKYGMRFSMRTIGNDVRVWKLKYYKPPLRN